jgi:hypothetical protein
MDQQIGEMEEHILANRQLSEEHERRIQSCRDKVPFRRDQTHPIGEDISGASSQCTLGGCYFMTEPTVLEAASGEELAL